MHIGSGSVIQIYVSLYSGTNMVICFINFVFWTVLENICMIRSPDVFFVALDLGAKIF